MKNKIIDYLNQAADSELTIDLFRPDEKFGDFSTNVAFNLSKSCNSSPIEIAENLVGKIKETDFESKIGQISQTNGFINIKLNQSVLVKSLSLASKPTGDLLNKSRKEQTILIEYFSNNVAKPPHVGHLRSGVIGDSLVRIYRYLGYKVVSDAHIGDWGTQFGILIYAFKTMGKKELVEKDPINELNALYVEMSRKIDADPSLREKGKAEFKKLEGGDLENRQLWQWFVDESLNDFEKYKKLLGLLPFDHNLGESFYEKYMPQILDEFKSKGLITKGETGELYVDLEEYSLGRCILVKSDGATTYHLRDFATYIFRKKEFNFEKSLLVVDNRQTHHFKQLNKVLELAGYPAMRDYIHVDLGFMSLPEGPISTRAGNIVSLKDLIEEAKQRALKIIDDKNPDLANKNEVAEKVGLAAVKYFDLSHNRKTEIVFDWDKSISFDGNTGPYLQYTYARLKGILRKADRKWQGTSDEGLALDPKEEAVLRQLIHFADVLEGISRNDLPSDLCSYLFELAGRVNSLYQSVPVLQEEDQRLKDFRLYLISSAAQIIGTGLNLLGIESLEEI